jgi:Flp pilus assembly protein TadG
MTAQNTIRSRALRVAGCAVQSCIRRYFREDTRGAAAAEFALVLPLLATIWLGAYAASEAVTTYRKLTDTTAQLANIAARGVQTSQVELTADMSAASQIMYPISTARLKIVVTQIQTDGASVATVAWSQGFNGATPFVGGSAWTLPTALMTPNSAYILVQTSYQYQPSIGSNYFGVMSIPMASQLYMPPRQIACIPCPDCTGQRPCAT